MEDRTSIAVSRATRKEFLKLVSEEDINGKNTDESMRRLLNKYKELKGQAVALE